MKRFCAIMIVFVFLCTMMTACAMDRGGRGTVTETPVVSPEMIPDTSPLPTPDVENGIVGDEDEMIEDPDLPAPHASSSVPMESPKISSSPEVSAKP